MHQSFIYLHGENKATKKVVHLSTSTPEKTRVCAYWREGVNQGNILNTQIQMYCIFWLIAKGIHLKLNRVDPGIKSKSLPLLLTPPLTSLRRNLLGVADDGFDFIESHMMTHQQCNTNDIYYNPFNERRHLTQSVGYFADKSQLLWSKITKFCNKSVSACGIGEILEQACN